jgi:hypothetical protein
VFEPLRAAGIAAGWGGDRLRVLARGDAMVFVWLSAWDSEADAQELADAVPALLSEASVERRGDRVLVLLGPDTSGLAARVWARSRFERHA